MASPWQNVWITGASSGICRQVAEDLARQGCNVYISARRQDVLEDIAAPSERLFPVPVDVGDPEQISKAVSQILSQCGSLDLVLLGAAVWHPMTLDEWDREKITRSMAINHSGVINCISPVLPGMIERQKGHIGILSSVAGYRGLPRSLAYGPTKAALINLSETLYPELRKHNIDLSIINPGFVDTPMTRVNEFPMPWIMSVDKASQIIIRGLQKQKFEIAFPWQMVWLLKFSKLLPYPLFFWFIRTFMKTA